MTFLDHVNSFVNKLYPTMHIKNVDSLHSKEIEVVYQLARQWANHEFYPDLATTVAVTPAIAIPGMANLSLVRFSSGKWKSSPPVAMTIMMAKDSNSNSKEFDVIEADKLKKMD